MAVVQRGQHPRFCGMDVYTLDALRARAQLFLDVQTERLSSRRKKTRTQPMDSAIKQLISAKAT